MNREAKELYPHGSPQFPCAGYAAHYTDRQEDVIPWHWHEEMEIIYIAEGQMKVRVPSQTFLLKEGDCAAINSNILHYCVASPECELRSFVFSPALLAGNEEFVFAKKYVRPLLACSAFTGYFLDGETHAEVIGWFRSAFAAIVEESYGYEFLVRENLSRICLFLHREFEAQIEMPDTPLSPENARIRKMLDYIHKHFAEEVSLADIAREADISERECLRCFQKTIQLSPMQYLLKYRVMQGAQKLLEDPGCSIAETAAWCGFDSQSHFAKMFRRFYECTPREYRKEKNMR